MTAAIILLALVTAERLGEVWLGRRNTGALLAKGAVERSPGHYPLIILVHTAWLAGLWLMGWQNPVDGRWLIVFCLLQAVRVWVMAALGRRWTTRIIIVPGETLVTRGPYRFLPHPNYLVVIGEIAVLPLCLGLPWYALLFSLLNAPVVAIRIRAENAAFQELPHAASN